MKGIRMEGLERQLEKLEHGKIVIVSDVQDIKRQIERKKAKNLIGKLKTKRRK